MGRFVFIGLFSLAIMACNDDSIAPQAGSSYIVEAYIYANEPIDHVKVSHVDPSGSWVSEGVYDADVQLTQDGLSYQLAPVSNCATCYGALTSTEIFGPGDSLKLSIKVGGIEMRSSTVFPPSILNLQASIAYVDLATHDASMPVVQLSWDALEGYQYALFLRPIGDAGEPIWNTTPPIEHPNPLVGILDEPRAAIYAEHLSTYGTFEIYVTAVSGGYASFLRRSNAPNAGVPLGNIINGEGIFTAFNGSTVNLEIE